MRREHLWLAWLILAASRAARAAEPVTWQRGVHDVDRFLKRYPEYEFVDWKPYTVLLGRIPGKEKGSARETALAVFDAERRRIYERAAESPETSSAYRRLSSPRVVAVPGRVLAFQEHSGGPWQHCTELRLVGFRNKAPTELLLPYGAGGSAPFSYTHRTWLEDVTGDGKSEICRFEFSRLKVYRWDAEHGTWQWLRRFTGTRIGTPRAPIRWHYIVTREKAAGEVAFDIRMTSLADRPVVLSRSLATLFEREWPPEGVAIGPFSVKCGQPGSARRPATWWTVRPHGRPPATLTIPPLATRSVAFRVPMPDRAFGNGDYRLHVTGRARWGSFEANFHRYNHRPIVSRAPPDAAGQRAIDAEYIEKLRKGQLARTPSAYVDMSHAGTRVRRWLLARLGGDNHLRLLHLDVADETGRLALQAIKGDTRISVAHHRELLLLALRRRDPAEYRAVIQEATAATKGLEPVLKSLSAAR